MVVVDPDDGTFEYDLVLGEASSDFFLEKVRDLEVVETEGRSQAKPGALLPACCPPNLGEAALHPGVDAVDDGRGVAHPPPLEAEPDFGFLVPVVSIPPGLGADAAVDIEQDEG